MGAEGAWHFCAQATKRFTIVNGLKDDVDGDGKVDAADLVTTANIVIVLYGDEKQWNE